MHFTFATFVYTAKKATSSNSQQLLSHIFRFVPRLHSQNKSDCIMLPAIITVIIDRLLQYVAPSRGSALPTNHVDRWN